MSGRTVGELALRRQGIYVPAYLYSAVARSAYTAQIGEDYTETETYTDSDGKTQTRTVTRTDWLAVAAAACAGVEAARLSPRDRAASAVK